MAKKLAKKKRVVIERKKRVQRAKELVIPQVGYSRQQILEIVREFTAAINQSGASGIKRKDDLLWDKFPKEQKRINDAMEALWKVAKEA